MAFLAMLAMFAITTGDYCADAAVALRADVSAARISGHSPFCGMSDGACRERMNDEQVLLQTELEVAPGRPDAGENRGGMLQRVFQWLVKAETVKGNAIDAAEVAKRFHKDFIAAALIVCSVLPWSHRPDRDGTRTSSQHHLRRILPSHQYFRFLCVLLLWLRHYWLNGQNLVLDAAFVILGFAFDFGLPDSEETVWSKLSDFLPDRFAQIYPFYTLYVVVCHVLFFSSPCIADKILGEGSWLLQVIGLVAWLFSVAFGCMLVLPALSSPPQHIQAGASAMFSVGCAAMVLLPRTLANGPSDASLIHSSLDGAALEVFFARKALLLGLARFCFGLVMSRLVATCSRWLPGLAASISGKRLAVQTGCGSAHNEQSGGNADDAMWKEFGEEAERFMMQSFSISEQPDLAQQWSDE